METIISFFDLNFIKTFLSAVIKIEMEPNLDINDDAREVTRGKVRKMDIQTTSYFHPKTQTLFFGESIESARRRTIVMHYPSFSL